MDGLVAAMASGQTIGLYKASVTDQAAGMWTSLWTGAGMPGAGATPTSGAGDVPTNSTAGAVALINAGGSNTLYLAQVSLGAVSTGVIYAYDRLVETSGLSGTVTSAQTVNTTSLTRYTSGVGVQAWLEVYTALGSTSVTASVSYTNTLGTSGRTGTATFPASAKVAFATQIALQAGDLGVESVQSVTLSATTGTAGNFGVTLAYPIFSAPLAITTGGVIYDYASLALPVIQPNACIALYVLPSSATATGVIFASLNFVQG